MIETTKWVLGYEGIYEVTTQGRIFSYQINEYHELALSLSSCGYLIVELFKNGVGKMMSVHRIVLEAFVGPCPPGMEGCHNNGIYEDNRLENLRWDTKSNNSRDAIKHGTSPILLLRGENHWNHILTEQQVQEIRALIRYSKRKQRRIAQLYEVSEGTISMISTNKIWKEVPFLTDEEYHRLAISTIKRFQKEHSNYA